MTCRETCTALSTISVQHAHTHISLCVLQSGSVLQLQLVQVQPGLCEIGSNQEENFTLIMDQQELMDKLKKHEADALVEIQTKWVEQRRRSMQRQWVEQNEACLEEAVLDSLKEGWALMLRLLHRRQLLLRMTQQFYHHVSTLSVCVDRLEQLQLRPEAGALCDVLILYQRLRRDILEKSLEALSSFTVLQQELHQLQSSENHYRRSSQPTGRTTAMLEQLMEQLQDRRRGAEQWAELQLQQWAESERDDTTQELEQDLILDHGLTTAEDFGNLEPGLSLKVDSGFKSTEDSGPQRETMSEQESGSTQEVKLGSRLNIDLGYKQESRTLQSGSTSDPKPEPITEESSSLDIQVGFRLKSRTETEDCGNLSRSKVGLKTGPITVPKRRREQTKDLDPELRSEQTTGSQIELTSHLNPGSTLKHDKTKIQEPGHSVDPRSGPRPEIQDQKSPLPPNEKENLLCVKEKVLHDWTSRTRPELLSGCYRPLTPLKALTEQLRRGRTTTGFDPRNRAAQVHEELLVPLMDFIQMDDQHLHRTWEEVEQLRNHYWVQDQHQEVQQVSVPSHCNQKSQIKENKVRKSRIQDQTQKNQLQNRFTLVQTQQLQNQQVEVQLFQIKKQPVQKQKNQSQNWVLTQQDQVPKSVQLKQLGLNQCDQNHQTQKEENPALNLEVYSEKSQVQNRNLVQPNQLPVLDHLIQNQDNEVSLFQVKNETIQNKKNQSQNHKAQIEQSQMWVQNQQDQVQQLEGLQDRILRPEIQQQKGVHQQQDENQKFQNLNEKETNPVHSHYNQLLNQQVQITEIRIKDHIEVQNLNQVKNEQKPVQSQQNQDQDQLDEAQLFFDKKEQFQQKHVDNVQNLKIQRQSLHAQIKQSNHVENQNQQVAVQQVKELQSKDRVYPTQHEEKTQTKNRLRKTLQNLDCVSDLLDSSSLVELGSDLQVSNLRLCFSRARPHFSCLQAEVQAELRDSKEEEDLQKLLKLHQEVKMKIHQSESILELSTSFHRSANQLEALLHPRSGSTEEYQHIQDLVRRTSRLKTDICTATAHCEWAGFRTELLQSRMVVLDSLYESWQQEVTRHRDQRSRLLQDDIQQLLESMRNMKKRVSTVKFSFLKNQEVSRTMKAVRNQLQQVDQNQEKLQALRTCVEDVVVRLGSEVNVTRVVEDSVDQLQRMLGEVEHAVCEHRRRVELSSKLTHTVDQFQAWLEEARSTVVQVGGLCELCITTTTLTELYRQLETFVWPTVPQQEERISVITELVYTLHGVEEGQSLLHQMLSQHSEMMESIQQLSDRLMEMETKLKDREEQGDKEQQENKELRNEEQEDNKELRNKEQEDKELRNKEQEDKEQEETRELRNEEQEEKKDSDMSELKETGHTPDLSTRCKWTLSQRVVPGSSFTSTHRCCLSSSASTEFGRHLRTITSQSQHNAITNMPQAPPPLPDASAGGEAELDGLTDDEYECVSPDDISLPPLAETPESYLVHSDQEEGFCFSSTNVQTQNQQETPGTSAVQPQGGPSCPSPNQNHLSRTRSKSESLALNPSVIPDLLEGIQRTGSSTSLHGPDMSSVLNQLLETRTPDLFSNMEERIHPDVPLKGEVSLQTHQMFYNQNQSPSQREPLKCTSRTIQKTTLVQTFLNPVQSDADSLQRNHMSLTEGFPQHLQAHQDRRYYKSQSCNKSKPQHPGLLTMDCTVLSNIESAKLHPDFNQKNLRQDHLQIPLFQLEQDHLSVSLSTVPEDHHCPQRFFLDSERNPLDTRTEEQDRGGQNSVGLGYLKNIVSKSEDSLHGGNRTLSETLMDPNIYDQNLDVTLSVKILQTETKPFQPARTYSELTRPPHLHWNCSDQNQSFPQSPAPSDSHQPTFSPSLPQTSMEVSDLHVVPPEPPTVSSITTSTFRQQFVHDLSTSEQANPHVPLPPPPHLLTAEQDPDVCLPLVVLEEIRLTPQIQGPALPAPPTAQVQDTRPARSRPVSRAAVMEGAPVTLEVQVEVHPVPALSWSSSDGGPAQVGPVQDLEKWLVLDVLEVISEDWRTWFGTLCVLLWLLYLVLL
ncbi:coiled-coil domain-containing protein 141 isoform X2 [Gouania willdenowi]|uniref:coiled-coil domain-containing protein 141 isoform X2 n=1 Tax=Gouania willdenowi TaxID=441366 RepID=UPI001055E203|nr:coiled-coil domain-containing protein 141 isoform X2 [Gouania willdenowi]